MAEVALTSHSHSRISPVSLSTALRIATGLDRERTLLRFISPLVGDAPSIAPHDGACRIVFGDSCRHLFFTFVSVIGYIVDWLLGIPRDFGDAGPRDVDFARGFGFGAGATPGSAAAAESVADDEAAAGSVAAATGSAATGSAATGAANAAAAGADGGADLSAATFWAPSFLSAARM